MLTVYTVAFEVTDEGRIALERASEVDVPEICEVCGEIETHLVDCPHGPGGEAEDR